MNNNEVAKIIIGEFNGSLGKEMAKLFEKSQAYLRMSKPAADKLARNFACDYGRLNKAADAKVSITATAKQVKDNMGVLVTKTKTAGIVLTHPLNIFRVIVAWEDLQGTGIDIGTSRLELVKPLADYLAEIEKEVASPSEEKKPEEKKPEETPAPVNA